MQLKNSFTYYTSILLATIHLSSLLTPIQSIEYFSSFQHIKNLQKLENTLIQQFHDQLQEHQQHLNELKQYLNDLNKTSHHHIGNPVLQYQLIRRMVEEWPELISEVPDLSTKMKETFDQTSESHGGLPGKGDLDGSAEAIIRLQDTYLLDTVDFADGNLLGSQAPVTFSADDCFQIGRKAYLNNDMYHVILWMREAWRRVIEHEDDSHDEFEILDHLAYALSQFNYRKLALEANQRQIEIIETQGADKFDKEDVDRMYNNKGFYIAEVREGRDRTGDLTFGTLNVPKPPSNRYAEFDTYEELCRADGLYDFLPRRTTDKLFCTYSTQNNNPRLILKPAKIEILRIKPTFVMIHDLVEKDEVTQITALAEPRLNRATIQNPVTGNLETADYRVSKHAWLKPEDGEVVARLNQRIMDITGLDTEGLASEELQINDYGVGGQYEPHFDHATKHTAGDFGELRGNRIATVLIYFSQPELGGNTVFLPPKVVSKPIAGNAVFWYNLDPAGESDESTRHAGCPILVGQKWVANYWIHERGQEFRRTCDLNQYENSKFNIPGWKRDATDIPDW